MPRVLQENTETFTENRGKMPQYKCFGRMMRSACLVTVALVPSIVRAKMMAEAAHNAKHEAAERA
eukprot:1157328-Pelagomonas_calceolata.AAC.12